MTFKRRILEFQIGTLLALSKVIILVFSFRRIVSKLGGVHHESPIQLSPEFQSYAISVGRLIHKVSQKVPFNSVCFDRALTAKFLLSRKGIPATIYFGVAKDGDHKIKAHAWVRAGSEYITGGGIQDQYTKVASFA